MFFWHYFSFRFDYLENFFTSNQFGILPHFYVNMALSLPALVHQISAANAYGRHSFRRKSYFQIAEIWNKNWKGDKFVTVFLTTASPNTWVRITCFWYVFDSNILLHFRFLDNLYPQCAVLIFIYMLFSQFITLYIVFAVFAVSNR